MEEKKIKMVIDVQKRTTRNGSVSSVFTAFFYFKKLGGDRKRKRKRKRKMKTGLLGGDDLVW